MRVLITGATGFLGRRVVAALAARGHRVRALVRPSRLATECLFPAGVEIAYGDLRRRLTLPAALEEVDAVVHLAACVVGDDDAQFSSTVVGTENLLQAMVAAGVGRIVHCGTFSVYDWYRAGRVLDEQSPLEERLYARDGYAVAKIWQERLVRRYADQHQWKLTVLRPGFIWGPNAVHLSGIGQSLGRVFLVFAGRRPLPLTYVENCADCFARALDDPNAEGQTYNVVDDESVSAWRYQRLVMEHFDQRGLRIYVPYPVALGAACAATAIVRLWFRGAGKLPGVLVPGKFRARFRPLKFSNRKLRTELAWNPPWTFEQAWQRTVAAPSLASP